MARVAEEIERAERVVDNIEDLEEAKGDLEKKHPALERIERVQDREFEELPELRVRVAAELLGLSVPTIHKWTDIGLLEEVRGAIRRVTTRSVLAVRPHVLSLRELGMKRNLLDAVLARVDDEETLAIPSLRESIAAMERGELTDITPRKKS